MASLPTLKLDVDEDCFSSKTPKAFFEIKDQQTVNKTSMVHTVTIELDDLFITF